MYDFYHSRVYFNFFQLIIEICFSFQSIHSFQTIPIIADYKIVNLFYFNLFNIIEKITLVRKKLLNNLRKCIFLNHWDFI